MSQKIELFDVSNIPHSKKGNVNRLPGYILSRQGGRPAIRPDSRGLAMPYDASKSSQTASSVILIK
jgi:hypothetical protein